MVALGRENDIDMKKLIVIIVIVLITTACKQGQPLPDFNWIIGSWERIDDKPSKKTFEQWNATIDGKYIGYGHTIENGDTIFQENMVIKADINLKQTSKNPYVLEVSGVNENPTIFRIEEMNEHSFTAVNLENEFPTHITYKIKNDTLIAQVSNKEMSIDFKFVTPISH
jgi:hypothetical protein